MQKTALSAVAIIAAIILVGFSIWSLHTSQKNYVGMTESITIGDMPIEGSALIYIAEDQGFFKQNGLNVTIRDYDTGVAAINGLLNGDVDIANVAEYPLVGLAFKKERIQAVGCIDKSKIEYIVGRKDHGIENISDLTGKKIGLPRGTLPEFYLGRFLDLHGMSIRDVTLINIPQLQTADAIANGSVDAVVTREPYLSRIMEQHPNGTISWSVQSSQAVYSILICRNDWIKQHPDLVNRFLNSLAEADEYIVLHPDEAKALLQKRYHYDDAYVERGWPENQFSLSLDQSLVTALEDEGRWTINNNLTCEKTLPYFQDYIYTKGLEEVKPESVNIR